MIQLPVASFIAQNYFMLTDGPFWMEISEREIRLTCFSDDSVFYRYKLPTASAIKVKVFVTSLSYYTP